MDDGQTNLPWSTHTWWMIDGGTTDGRSDVVARRLSIDSDLSRFLCSLYYVVTHRYKLLGTDFYELSYLVLTSSNEANMLHCTKWNCVGFYLTWYESSGDNFYRETLTLQACQLRRSHTAVLSVEQLNSLNCFTWIIDSQSIPDQYVPEIYLFLRNEYIMTFTLPLSNAKWRGPLDVPGGTSLGLLL